MKILIIDDELPAREEIARLLGNEPDIQILGQCTNAIEGISTINRLNPEFIFLDIQMPRISGLEMLGMLDPEKMPRVGLQGLDELRRIRRNLGSRVRSPVFRFSAFRCLEPALDGVPAVARLPRDLGQRYPVPIKQAPNSSQVFHGDHLQKPCSINKQVS